MKPIAVLNMLAVLLTIAAVSADDKIPFKPGPASSYPNHQTLDKITIAAVPYISEDQVRSAFGKVNPAKYGVEPVLVVIQNDTGKTLRLDLRLNTSTPAIAASRPRPLPTFFTSEPK